MEILELAFIFQLIRKHFKTIDVPNRFPAAPLLGFTLSCLRVTIVSLKVQVDAHLYRGPCDVRYLIVLIILNRPLIVMLQQH